jgi:hypothetical protein
MYNTCLAREIQREHSKDPWVAGVRLVFVVWVFGVGEPRRRQWVVIRIGGACVWCWGGRVFEFIA